MTFRRSEYIEKYQRVMGEGVVRDIEFRMGRIKQPERGEEVENPLAGDIDGIELTREEILKADRMFRSIEDKETREMLKRAFIGQMKLNRWRKSRTGGQ
jgi:hypothetical protein